MNLENNRKALTIPIQHSDSFLGIINLYTCNTLHSISYKSR